MVVAVVITTNQVANTREAIVSDIYAHISASGSMVHHWYSLTSRVPLCVYGYRDRDEQCSC
jgi:hypothetical protein